MKKLLPWIVALVMLVVVFGSIYTVVQQSQRSDANYPQIQLAEDTAYGLNEGELSSTLLGQDVEMEDSLAPFVIIYRKDGSVMQGSGKLDGKVPKAPLGALKVAKGKEYHAFTWGPKKGVRIAAVAVAGKDFYVLSGRNIKEVEKNETLTFQLSLLGGIISLGLLGLIYVLSDDEY